GERVRARDGKEPCLSILAKRVVARGHTAQRRIRAACHAGSDVARIARRHGGTRGRCRRGARRRGIGERDVEAIGAVRRGRRSKRVREKRRSYYCPRNYSAWSGGVGSALHNSLGSRDGDRVREEDDSGSRRCSGDRDGGGDRVSNRNWKRRCLRYTANGVAG